MIKAWSIFIITFGSLTRQIRKIDLCECMVINLLFPHSMYAALHTKFDFLLHLRVHTVIENQFQLLILISLVYLSVHSMDSTTVLIFSLSICFCTYNPFHRPLVTTC
uniref:Putative ovule protein n=1 Tax=Solanum chacoense TaxID=4108 RepID=A0A0V0GVI0_SOLCH